MAHKRQQVKTLAKICKRLEDASLIFSTDIRMFDDLTNLTIIPYGHPFVEL